MTLAVIIPVYNSSHLLEQTLRAIRNGTRLPDELIVVDDRSTDSSATVAEELGARVLRMSINSGPAACRNRAARDCESDVLVFLDADTCVHPDTVERIENHLVRDPGLSAVIGAYDDTPKDAGLCSQYRNLAHTYVHRSANRNALTFWSGCGAVRRTTFVSVGGFSERYRRPSVEDIELGYRLSDRGLRILLDPAIQVTHTKRWTFWNCVKTDVVDRGIPWMPLLLQRGKVPDDLNIRIHHRVAVLLTGAGILCVLLSFRSAWWFAFGLALFVIALGTDFGLLSFLYRERGVSLLIVGAVMTLVQNVCKLVALGGALLGFAFGSRSSEQPRIPSRSAVVTADRGSNEEPTCEPYWSVTKVRSAAQCRECRITYVELKGGLWHLLRNRKPSGPLGRMQLAATQSSRAATRIF